MKLTPIHPFPARMAPEIVLDSLRELPPGSTILDPMSGSGTVLRASVELGHDGIGFDADPLAVLMARVWTRRIPEGLSDAAQRLADEARADRRPSPPDWHTDCTATSEFAKFWFEPRQYRGLSALATRLSGRRDKFSDALRLALSRTIITKERGASVARDTSHSRPHRVFFDNDFDVFHGFVLAARRIEDRLRSAAILGSATIRQGDARSLNLEAESVDAVITSPPYLNAIDYMRGHRLALIWLGRRLIDLRGIRSRSIGAEAGLDFVADMPLPNLTNLSSRHQRIVARYCADIGLAMKEIRRVLRPGGRAFLIVGNSTLTGVNISNADINIGAAKQAGLRLLQRVERDLPTRSRYLPVVGGGEALSKRMRTETVLSFAA